MILEFLLRHKDMSRREFYGTVLRTLTVAPAIGAAVYMVANLFAPEPFPAFIPAITGAAFGLLGAEAIGAALVKSSTLRYAFAHFLSMLLLLGLFVAFVGLRESLPERSTAVGVVGWLAGSHFMARAIASPKF